MFLEIYSVSLLPLLLLYILLVFLLLRFCLYLDYSLGHMLVLLLEYTLHSLLCVDVFLLCSLLYHNIMLQLFLSVVFFSLLLFHLVLL